MCSIYNVCNLCIQTNYRDGLGIRLVDLYVNLETDIYVNLTKRFLSNILKSRTYNIRIE
ncbi:hypothetical protein HanIR_Chr13g0638591 [Helianthus annuus]|nr:hypothetical protein HanIR_Chr13g0638591 [Helianthus annuus]